MILLRLFKMNKIQKTLKYFIHVIFFIFIFYFIARKSFFFFIENLEFIRVCVLINGVSTSMGHLIPRKKTKPI